MNFSQRSIFQFRFLSLMAIFCRVDLWFKESEKFSLSKFHGQRKKKKKNFGWILIGGRSKLASRFIFLFIFFVARVHPFVNPMREPSKEFVSFLFFFFYPESDNYRASSQPRLESSSKTERKNKRSNLSFTGKFSRFSEILIRTEFLLNPQDSFLHFQNSRRNFLNFFCIPRH